VSIIDWKSEVLHIRQTLACVKNHEAGHTHLIFQEPKTAHSRRTIPLPEGCLAALRQYRAHQAEERLALGQAYDDHGLVFCQADGRSIDPRTLNRYFSQALAQAALPPIRLHDARHTFATWLLEQGVSPKVVQTMLGHSSIAITLDIYSYVSLELEKQAAATLNAVLASGLQ
jgi:integrase